MDDVHVQIRMKFLAHDFIDLQQVTLRLQGTIIASNLYKPRSLGY